MKFTNGTAFVPSDHRFAPYCKTGVPARCRIVFHKVRQTLLYGSETQFVLFTDRPPEARPFGDSLRHFAFVDKLPPAFADDQAVQGFAYADLRRALAPFLVHDVYHDRGEALERAWMANEWNYANY
jgi:hypothetical protein